MESNHTEPIIIEFNGLPGCGKSTICRQLKKNLEDSGHNVFLTYERKFTLHNLYWILLNPKYWGIILKTLRYANLFKKQRSLFRILHLASFVRMYSHFISDNQKGILIIDQGILQSIISLAHTDRLIDSRRLTQLIKASGLDSSHFYLINCQINPEIADTRMLSRPLNGARIGRLSREQRCKALETQIYNLSFIHNQISNTYPDIPQINIDTEYPIDSSVNEIIKKL